MSKHAPEPWSFPARLKDARGAFIPMTEENARRVVACINACEGIPTEKLEDSQFRTCDSMRGYYNLVPQK